MHIKARSAMAEAVSPWAPKAHHQQDRRKLPQRGWILILSETNSSETSQSLLPNEPHTHSQFSSGITEFNQEASLSSEGEATDCQTQGMRPPGPA